jgi:hypothetical protein
MGMRPRVFAMVAGSVGAAAIVPLAAMAAFGSLNPVWALAACIGMCAFVFLGTSINWLPTAIWGASLGTVTGADAADKRNARRHADGARHRWHSYVAERRRRM